MLHRRLVLRRAAATLDFSLAARPLPGARKALPAAQSTPKLATLPTPPSEPARGPSFWTSWEATSVDEEAMPVLSIAQFTCANFRDPFIQGTSSRHQGSKSRSGRARAAETQVAHIGIEVQA
eukprot:9501387-Pyramimonas_sp.AAC.1